MDLSALHALHALHFLHPQCLLALPVLLLLVAWGMRRRRGSDAAWSRVVDAQLLPLLRLSTARGTRSAWILIGSAWLLALIALAGPTWERVTTPGYRLPGAWVILLDLSPSMGAADVMPDRATRARYAITDLLGAAKDARVALVAFAGEPYTVTPLTTDVATIRTLLQPLSPQLMPETGHELAPALVEAARLLRAGNAAGGQVIVLADGFDDEDRALAVSRTLKHQGLTIHVVGIGTASGAPERDASGGFVRDERGNILVTRMQSDLLERLAGSTGGRFVTLSGLQDLIGTLEKAGPPNLDAADTPLDVRVASWRNDGIWLVPPLLILAALLARKGWI
ncbi:MAG TPA: VWA domain-containing protein [Steroidobacteraceae bacterium]|nr:VWA domain-containing protein [Steroidobacteraceae bacterium]